ncbi:MAG: hypothetical protein WC156_03280 [Pedobacter sp.]
MDNGIRFLLSTKSRVKGGLICHEEMEQVQEEQVQKEQGQEQAGERATALVMAARVVDEDRAKVAELMAQAVIVFVLHAILTYRTRRGYLAPT